MSNRGGDWAMWLGRIDGSDLHELTPDPDYDPSSVTWSPSGSRLLSEDTSYGIHVLDPLTGESRRIGFGEYPSWSPDGTLIALETRDQRAEWITVVRPNGKLLWRRLGYRKVWSPDSRRLAIGSGRFAIYGRNGVKRWSGRGLPVGWAPNSGEFAYLSSATELAKLVVKLRDGRRRSFGSKVRNAAWSPDGSQILFTSPVAPNRWDVFVVEPRHGSPHRVLSDVDPYVLNSNRPDPPAWSPDGELLAATKGGEILVANQSGHARGLNRPHVSRGPLEAMTPLSIRRKEAPSPACGASAQTARQRAK